MSAVRCIDLCKTYRQGDEDIKALDHLSIEIDNGGFVCLSSPSGGGKTTLLNAIGGLDEPDSGEVWIDEQRIDNLEGEYFKRFMLHYNFPGFSVGEVGRFFTGRREVGHGNLAERALRGVVPAEEDPVVGGESVVVELVGDVGQPLTSLPPDARQLRR